MGNQPKNKERAGAISLTTWENEGKEGSKYSTFQIQRGYKDKEDKWQNTDSLRLNDIPKVIALLQKVYLQEIQAEKESKEGKEGE